MRAPAPFQLATFLIVAFTAVSPATSELARAQQPGGGASPDRQDRGAESRAEDVAEAAAETDQPADGNQSAKGDKAAGEDGDGNGDKASRGESRQAKSSRGAEPPSRFDGEVGQISSWGYAGILWSDAHLVRRIAAEAADAAEKSKRRTEMTNLVSQCDRLIDSLEQFGWRRVQARTDGRAGEGDAPSAATEGEADEGSLADRVETETPPGRNDPGVDDELAGDPEQFDVDRFRVDDYVDETPAEAASTADAVEDAAERALAEKVDTIGPDAVGHISRREVMTRSTTLPYARDTIYDVDDYDPNIDYDVENRDPTPGESSGLRAVRQGADERDDIDNENELVESLAGADETKRPKESAVRENVEPDLPVAPYAEADQQEGAGRQERADQRAGSREDGTRLSRFTPRKALVARDADWVQMHLKTTQAQWSVLQSQLESDNPPSLDERLDSALTELRATAATIDRASDNESLRQTIQLVP